MRKIEIKDCSGCGVCQNNGGICVIKDDMKLILDKMMDADVIVMGTPVYYSSMNGKMKTLIDRTFAKFREMKNKEFYFISTAASSDDKIMDDVTDVFRKFIYFLPGAVEKGTIFDGYAGMNGAIKEHAVYKKAYDMGKDI